MILVATPITFARGTTPMPDRRELLELLAYGRDPDLKPGDRLRALELLEELHEDDERALAFARDAAQLDPEQARVWEDAHFTVILGEIASGSEETKINYPGVAAAFKHILGERLRERVSAALPLSVTDSAPGPPEPIAEPQTTAERSVEPVLPETDRLPDDVAWPSLGLLRRDERY